MAVLGALYRNGDLTVGELAARERVQPPSMTRTVNCLVEDGHVACSVRHEIDRRQVVVMLTDTGPRRSSRPTGAAATSGWRCACASSPRPSAPCCAAPRPSSSDCPRRTDHHLEPHVPRPAQPQLPPVRRRQRGLEHRHLDAAGRPGLAGAQPPGGGGTALGITTGLQFLPVLLLSPYAGVVADRFPKRRLLQLTQATMAAGLARARSAGGHRSRRASGTSTSSRSSSGSARPSTPPPASPSSRRWSAPTT